MKKIQYFKLNLDSPRSFEPKKIRLLPVDLVEEFNMKYDFYECSDQTFHPKDLEEIKKTIQKHK